MQIYEEKRVLIRGLAHPVASGKAAISKPRKRGSPSYLAPPLQSAVDRLTGSNQGPGNAFLENGNNDEMGVNENELGAGTSASFLRRWGSVPVSGKALVSLLRAGETVLLFPGGGDEAIKSTRNIDRYALLWPYRPEFVRAAAKFGATIIPFGGIGVEENLKAVLNEENLKNVASTTRRFQGRDAQERQNNLRARPGLSADAPAGDDLSLKLYLPTPVKRFYFLFGRPIQVTEKVLKDRGEAERVYKQVKDSVSNCVTFLLTAREDDPYRDFPKRALFEQSRQTNAPGFDPRQPHLVDQARKFSL